MNALVNNLLLIISCYFLSSCSKSTDGTAINNDILLLEIGDGHKEISFTSQDSVVKKLVKIITNAHEGAKIVTNGAELSLAGKALKSAYNLSDERSKFVEIVDSKSGDVLFYINEVRQPSNDEYKCNISILETVDTPTYEKIYAEIRAMNDNTQ